MPVGFPRSNIDAPEAAVSLTTSLIAIGDLARPRHGVVAAHELDEVQLPSRSRARLVDSGFLVPVIRGVYRLGSSPETLESRCVAACLARDDVFITGRVGGRLWGVRRMGAIGVGSSIEVRLRHGAQAFSVPGIRQRRCNALDPSDVVTRADGIRIASPPRLLFDLALDLDLESAIEQVLDRNWCTMPTLLDTGRRLFHPARPGSTRFARVINSRSEWLRPADSHLEVQLFDALRSAGVTGLTRQHPIPLPGGWTIHADIAVPSLKWAIPVDHIEWHGGRVDAQRDKQNDRQARSLGWVVDRVTDEDIDDRLAATTAELLAVWRRLRSAA